MKKKFFTIAVMAASLVMSSCSNDDAPQMDSAKYITVTTEISGMSRVATDSVGNQNFENGDVISVYAWTGTSADGKIVAPAKDERLVNYSLNTLTGSSWIAEPQMLWKNMYEKHYFIGVYPAIEQGKGLDDDLTKYAYMLDPADEKASDLLVAVQTDGILAGNGSVPLEFTHTMAKVNVNLTYRNQWGVDENGNNKVPTVTSMQLANVANQATVNLFTKEVTPAEGRDALTLPVVAENTRYSSLIIPQNNVKQITIVIDGKIYVYKHSTDIIFESGKVTTMNLAVGRDVISIDGITINPWEEASDSIFGEAVEN